MGRGGCLAFKTAQASKHPPHPPTPCPSGSITTLPAQTWEASEGGDAAIKASIGVSFSHSPNAAVSWLKAWLLLSEGEGRVVRGGGVDLS